MAKKKAKKDLNLVSIARFKEAVQNCAPGLNLEILCLEILAWYENKKIQSAPMEELVTQIGSHVITTIAETDIERERLKHSAN